MTRITITNNEKQNKSEFIDLIKEQVQEMTEFHVNEHMIVAHVGGMLSTATWAGLLSTDDAESIMLAVLIDTGNE